MLQIILKNMNFVNKLQSEYDQLWKLIIRPNRSPYPDSALGPETFVLQNRKIKRIDFQLINPKGKVFYVSHFIPLESESYPCLIYMHGNSSNRTEGMEYLGELIRRNISLCTFDFTGCGNAEGEYVTLGYYEWEDLHQVVEWIRHKEKVTTIGIWGRSMGAVTGLVYLKKSQHIQVGVFDSPFKSLKALLEDLCKKNSKIPMFILAGALKIISGTIYEKADFDIYKLNPLKNEVPYVKYPAFFIVGRDDELIPHTHTQELFSAYKGDQKQIRIVAGGHNDERPDKCIQDVINFLAEHLKKKSPIKLISETTILKTKPTEDLLSGERTNDQVDFFADQVKKNIEEPLDQKQEKMENIYEDFQNMKEQEMKAVDFFANEVNNLDLNAENTQEKEKNNFSLTQMFSSVMGKAKGFNFGLVNSKEKGKDNIKQDRYEVLRDRINASFRHEESDLQEQIKMQIVRDLARIKMQEGSYGKQFINENEDKIDSWVFS